MPMPEVEEEVAEVEVSAKRKRRWHHRKKKSAGSGKAEGEPPGDAEAEPSKKKQKKNDPEAESKKHGHRNRCKKRQGRTEAALLHMDEEMVKATAQQHGTRHYSTAEEATTNFAAAELRQAAASTGYIGNPRTDLPEVREYQLKELVGDGSLGFNLITAKDRTQYVPCPKTKKIYAVIDPGPRNDPTWEPDCNEGAEFIKAGWEESWFPDDDTQRRGSGFSAVSFGMSSGNGQPRPMMLNHQGTRRKRVMEKIRHHRVFLRIAGFMSSRPTPARSGLTADELTFWTWAPMLFMFYVLHTGALLRHYPDLRLPFENAVFAAFTVNFGPRTVTFPHRDSKNLAFGWCAITALGKFNYKLGGHLVLWDLKLVIKFPPGTTIFVPSAVVCHFNTAIQPHEEWYSFTLYTAGDLFRWAEHGFQHEQDYRDTPAAAAEQSQTRWERGLDLFLTLEELKASTA
ncbi:hypothetical protein V5O48_006989 [Marasmius crinis-equi]|uniref:Uncharacterized protein n=1 Tax=Marasmius crinis-equi TaxID=585013 RepID=A0ABR3FHY9_9AGAR